MGKPVIRGTISPRLYEECMELKKDILKKGIVNNPHLLTLPKLQEILLSKRALNFRTISAAEIKRIVLG